jgi:MoaA/NifB/PqqE/SkfB family radical SAM enzyme
VALYLDPSGLVTACCANSAYVLGRIHEGEHTDSLTSIWQGARARRLRSAVDAGDLSLGCQQCAAGVAAGQPERTLAREFDRFWPEIVEAFPRYIDFALSNTCNLQCVMCNGDLSSAIRSRREGRAPLMSPYGDRFFDELAGFLPHLHEASFKGGEPFLSIEARRVWDLLIELDLRPRITVTTNGTVWNRRVEHYLRTLQMDVSISVDGSSPGTVESLRVGTDHAELRRNIARIHAITSESGSSLVLNYCLMPQNWREFGAFLDDAERSGLPVHVVEVSAPASFDLLQLPRDDLVRVLGELETEGAELEHSLHLNLDTWRTQVSRVRAAVEWHDATPASPVELRARRGAHDPRSELTATTDAPLLEVELVRGVVTSVRSAPWAEDLLAPDSWIGSGDHDLLARIADSLGTAYPEVLIDDRGDGTISATLAFSADGGTLTMGAAVVVDQLSGRPSRLMIAEPRRIRSTPS